MSLLIDADIITYRAGFACEHRLPDGTKEIEPESYAIHNARMMIYNMFMRLETAEHKLFLTATNDPTNFRLKIYPEYKANRKKLSRPVHYEAIREFLVNQFGAEVVYGIEADDALSIAQYENMHLPAHPGDTGFCDTCICSIDKDLDIVPGWHYNFVKGHHYFQTQLEGLRCFYKQILTGDAVDNIPRIKKGWKCKDAFTLLDKATSESEMFDVVVYEIHDVVFDSATIEPEEVYKLITNRGRLLWPLTKPEEQWSPTHLLPAQSF